MALALALNSFEALYIRLEINVKSLFYYIIASIVKICFKCSTLFQETWIRKIFVKATTLGYSTNHADLYSGNINCGLAYLLNVSYNKTQI